MIIGGKVFDFDSKPYIMGILNMTPDSFSGDGNINNIDSALKQVENMVQNGAAIIDIGGESTRPGHVKVTVNEELDRVSSIIELIKANFDVPLSLDTNKYEVAKEGIRLGVEIINDINALEDDRMAELVAQSQVAVCLMHNKRIDNLPIIEGVISDLIKSVDKALKFGISKCKIIIDPGIGFEKDLQQNLQIMNQLEKLLVMNYPILLGCSRKRIIGESLNLGIDEREEGTIATTIYGRMKGCSIFRVHNVCGNYRALQMYEKMESVN